MNQVLRYASWAVRTISVGLFIVAAALIVVSTPKWQSISQVAFCVIGAIVAGFLALVLTAARQHRLFRLPPEVPKPISDDTLMPDLLRWYSELTSDDIEQFCSMLIRPSRYFLRIAESATPVEGHTLISSKYTMSVPADSFSSNFMVPLIVKERSVLSDGLKIMDADGHRISSVVQREAMGFVAAVCRRLVEVSGLPGFERTYIEGIESRVIDIVRSPSQYDALEYLLTISQLNDLRSSASHPEWIVVLMSVLRRLRQQFPVMVAVQQDDVRKRSKSNVTLRYTVDQDIVLTQRWFSRLNSRAEWFELLVGNLRMLVQLLVGTKPNDLFLPLDNADRCESYHLQCDGIQGAYLGDQHLERPDDGSTVRIKPRRGQSYSHIYIQGGSEYAGRYFVNWFYEIPPGSSGFAVAVAFVTLFGLVILGWNQLNWHANNGLSSFTLLIALPGAIGAFLGFGRTSGFFQGSIRARLSTIVSLGASLFGLLSATIVTRSTHYSASLFARDLHNLPPIVIFWLVLVLFQAVNLALSGSAWLFRTYVYWSAKAS